MYKLHKTGCKHSFFIAEYSVSYFSQKNIKEHFDLKYELKRGHLITLQHTTV